MPLFWVVPQGGSLIPLPSKGRGSHQSLLASRASGILGKESEKMEGKGVAARTLEKGQAALSAVEGYLQPWSAKELSAFINGACPSHGQL
jgi:hypothetical protein